MIGGRQGFQTAWPRIDNRILTTILKHSRMRHRRHLTTINFLLLASIVLAAGCTRAHRSDLSSIRPVEFRDRPVGRGTGSGARHAAGYVEPMLVLRGSLHPKANKAPSFTKVEDAWAFYDDLARRMDARAVRSMRTICLGC
ncbi:hypothetical protein [Methylobacterium sp. ID0610]|uniref:hypothetical protein n=1 Tax=Methylobacterium carpenticola TaxID=3344827 RepID=UPI0036CAC7A7